MGAGCALWQPEPADFAHPESDRPPQLRGRARRLRLGISAKWPPAGSWTRRPFAARIPIRQRRPICRRASARGKRGYAAYAYYLSKASSLPHWDIGGRDWRSQREQRLTVDVPKAALGNSSDRCRATRWRRDGARRLRNRPSASRRAKCQPPRPGAAVPAMVRVEGDRWCIGEGDGPGGVARGSRAGGCSHTSSASRSGVVIASPSNAARRPSARWQSWRLTTRGLAPERAAGIAVRDARYGDTRPRTSRTRKRSARATAPRACRHTGGAVARWVRAVAG